MYFNYINTELESWEDTIKRYSSRLNELESKSLALIERSVMNNDRISAVLYSGGKDSSIVAHLVDKVLYDNPLLIFNDTTLDCADTYKYIKTKKNLMKIKPQEGFYQWRNRMNFIPTRFARACCSIFKEDAMIKRLNKDIRYLFFMGMRNQESSKRANYTDVWVNNKWKDRDWIAVLPIREWSELDVWLYILKEKIDINGKYKKGYSRVGCGIACPYYSKSTWALDKYWYPKAFNRWQNILREDFRKNNKDIIMNCTEDEYLTCWNGGVFRDEPTEEVIEEFSERNNLSFDVAKNYFNHTCDICSKKIKDKNTLGMNMKINGRGVGTMYCKKHLKEKLELTDEQWDQMIDNFKKQGCELF